MHPCSGVAVRPASGTGGSPVRIETHRQDARATTFMNRAWLLILALLAGASFSRAASADDMFQDGLQAYRNGEFSQAASLFSQSAAERPAEGTFLNLGNAQWNRGRTGPAILSWERALWLNPADSAARNNLSFARDTVQVESPQLRWYEEASGWLSATSWAWVTALSLWVVAGFMTLPTVLRLRRVAWHQAVMAVGAAVFLFSIPAHVGLATRSCMGIVLDPNTPLRLTPTQDAEEVTRLGAGEPARCLRTRGDYIYVRLNRASGWLRRGEIGLINEAAPVGLVE